MKAITDLSVLLEQLRLHGIPIGTLEYSRLHAIFAANVLNGVDKDCRAWTAKFRPPAAEGEAGGRRGGRRRRRG